MHPTTRRLGEVLVDAQVLEPDVLALALEHQRETGQLLGRLLVEMGAVDDKTLTAGLATQMGLPVADLRHVRPDRSTLRTLPAATARRLLALPLRPGPEAVVAVADPPDSATVEELGRHLGRPIRFSMAPRSELIQAISRWYGSPSPLAEAGVPTDLAAAASRLLASTTGLVVVVGPTPSTAEVLLRAALAEVEKAGRSTAPVGEQPPSPGWVASVPILDTPALARRAVDTARDGWLVVAGVRAESAEGALASLDRLGITADEQAGWLTAVLVRTSIRTLCGSCRTARAPDPREIQLLARIWPTPVDRVYEGSGCSRCAGSGYVGLTHLHDLMVLDDAARAQMLGLSRDDCIPPGDAVLPSRLLARAAELAVSGRTTTFEVMRLDRVGHRR